MFSLASIARLGAFLVRKRPILFVPLFALSVGLVRPCPHETALEASAFALVLLAWTLRVRAMGFRNWVRGEGLRHLMTRGPYAWVRHPRYVANFLAGLAWFGLVFDPILAAVYSLVYAVVLGAVIVREEEKLAKDYPGFEEWRARVPAVLPAIWRRPWRSARPTEPGEEFDLATVLRGKEHWKLLGFLAALALLALARRSGKAFFLLGAWLSG